MGDNHGMSNLTSTLDIATRITGSTVDPKARTGRIQYACLIQYSGGSLGKRYVLSEAEMNIGRGLEAAIILMEDSVSREHAQCTVLGDVVAVEDLGSSNGTFINNERIQSKSVLRDGDILRLGGVHLKYFGQNSIENVFHDEIYRKATIDADTQVFNKQYLLEALESAFAYSRKLTQPLSVVYFDLDHFKKVNDTHGHSCGDFILRESVQLAKSCLRQEDVLGRCGGEEFVIVLPGCDVQLAASFAERIRKTLETHAFVYEGKTLTQTVSMGVSEIAPEFKGYKDLLDDADRKVYQSKKTGRNRVTL